MNKMDISIVSPVYKAEKIIDKLINQIVENISEITVRYEIILVEDGSPDRSWDVIERCARTNKSVKGIKLSRNFGQHYAITAGLQHAKGEWIIVMDCDLQDKPDQIIKLFKTSQDGFDIVYAKRTKRIDGFFKRLSSTVFYKIFSYLTDTKQDKSIANFGIYSNKVIQAILSMNDHIRYFPTMSQWVGFSKAYVEVEHGDREHGNSSYSWKKLIHLAFNNIISFSDKPLRLTIRLGLFISFVSGIFGIISLFRYFNNQIIVSGYTSIIISIWFLSGVIIFIIGIIGIYLAKVFDKAKDRPLFIVDKKLNI